MSEIYVGRQAIYDRDMNVHAYEILYRSGMENSAGDVDGDMATSEVILNTFTDLGLQRIVGKHRAYINVTRGFLLGEYPLPHPSQWIVLEVLENEVVDQALVTGVAKLKRAGYGIALDDFVFTDAWRPLLELADVVKLDVRATDPKALRDLVARLRPYGVRLLAEKVETQVELDFCAGLGMDYFQGYFYCRPNIVRGRRVSANRMATLRLTAKAQSPDTDVGELERMVSKDLSLSYKLLRYINSALFGLPRKVDSIRQALVYLGQEGLRTWISLIAMSQMQDKPEELILTALLRARMCENLAETLGEGPRSSFFLVGLFSVLDALLDMPMAEVLEQMPLSEDMSSGLRDRSGRVGAVLERVLDYEQGHWSQTGCGDLDCAVLVKAYLDAVDWADRAVLELRGSD